LKFILFAGEMMMGIFINLFIDLQYKAFLIWRVNGIGKTYWG